MDKKTRSRVMSRIRAKDTRPEIIVRSFLHRRGFRFRKHSERVPGKPDLILPKYSVVIFVHGCFWHQHEGCRYSVIPKSNREYWDKKLLRNQQRDQINIDEALKKNWRVLIIWECGLKDEPEALDFLPAWIMGSEDYREWPDLRKCT